MILAGQRLPCYGLENHFPRSIGQQWIRKYHLDTWLLLQNSTGVTAILSSQNRVPGAAQL